MAESFTIIDYVIFFMQRNKIFLALMAPLLFVAGADALMTGDYLTTKGRMPDEDRQMLTDLGLELVRD